MNWIDIKNNRVSLVHPFPKRMTLKHRLIAAIEKWDKIAAYHHAAGSNSGLKGVCANTCALCARYAKNDECEGCPVSIKTGQQGCYGTPFITYQDHPSAATARKEAIFLRALLKDQP